MPAMHVCGHEKAKWVVPVIISKIRNDVGELASTKAIAAVKDRAFVARDRFAEPVPANVVDQGFEFPALSQWEKVRELVEGPSLQL
jgi:hypothetical protein